MAPTARNLLSLTNLKESTFFKRLIQVANCKKFDFFEISQLNNSFAVNTGNIQIFKISILKTFSLESNYLRQMQAIFLNLKSFLREPPNFNDVIVKFRETSIELQKNIGKHHL